MVCTKWILPTGRRPDREITKDWRAPVRAPCLCAFTCTLTLRMGKALTVRISLQISRKPSQSTSLAVLLLSCILFSVPVSNNGLRPPRRLADVQQPANYFRGSRSGCKKPKSPTKSYSLCATITQCSGTVRQKRRISPLSTSSLPALLNIAHRCLFQA